MDNKKIKILHISQANGGVSEYLKSFLKYGDKKIYENSILVSNDFRKEEKEYIKLVKNINYIDMCRDINIKKDTKSIFKIYKYIKNNKPDIIYAHSSKAGAIARIAAVCTKTPIIYNAHGWAFDMDISDKKKMVYSLIEKLLALITNKIIVISENDLIKAKKFRIAKNNKIMLIKNGIDICKFSNKIDKAYIKNKYKINKQSYVVGMVARISEQKDPRTFVEMARVLNEKFNDIHFVLVGDGEQRNEIEQLLEKYKLKNNFTITGWVNNVNEIINIFDVGILTSKWEGFGLVIPEYFAAKIPVVASDVGGISNIINDGINGILVNSGDFIGFRDAVVRYRSNRDFTDNIIKEAFIDLKNEYDIRRVVKQHETLYNSILKNN